MTQSQLTNSFDENELPSINYPELFDEIRTQCKRRDYSLPDVISELDVKHEGKITRYKFEKVFNYISLWMSQAKLESIIKDYTVFDTVDIETSNPDGTITKTPTQILFKDQNEVTYVDTNQFLSDYENYIQNKTTRNISSSQALQESDIPTVDELIRFGRMLRVQSTTIEEVMNQYDTLHVGHVSPNQFLNGFGMNQLTKKLCHYYQQPPTNDVYYLILSDDVKNAMECHEESITMKLSQSSNETQTNSVYYKGKEMPDFFREFAHKLNEKGIDPYLVFKQYDRTKTHSILPCHFLSECASFPINIPYSQVQLLKDIFLNHQERFDYVSFAKAVEYENQQFEEEYQRHVKERTQEIQRQLAHEDENMKKDVSDVLKYIKKTIEDRHSLVCELFVKFDNAHTGKLDANRFFAILDHEHFDLDYEDKQALLEEFVDSDNKSILYQPFVIAVTPQNKNKVDITPEMILDRLMEYLDRIKVSIKPLMQRLDSDKTGKIGFRQLLSVFANVSFDIDKQERRVLLNYTTYDVNIDSFCNKVDYLPKPAVKNEEEKRPKQEEVAIEEEQEILPPKLILDALARLYSILEAEKNTIDINDEFMKYNSKSNMVFINLSQFRSVLVNLPSFEKLSNDDIELFEDHYYDGKSGKICLRTFLSDLNKYAPDQLKMEPSLSLYPTLIKRETPIPQNTNNQTQNRNQKSRQGMTTLNTQSPIRSNQSQSISSPFQLHTTETAVEAPMKESVAQFLQKFKGYLKSKELSAHSLFRMYDGSHTGYVTKSRVPSIMASIGFIISDSELSDILAAFQSQRLKDSFNYRRFINKLDSLEPNTEELRTMKVTPRTIVHNQNQESPDYSLTCALNTLHSKLFERRKTAASAFADVTEDFISADDFRDRLQNYDLILPLEHVHCYVKNYRANMNNEIDWRKFCHDVDTSRIGQPPK